MKKQFWKSFTFRQLFACYVSILLLSTLFSFVFYLYYARVFSLKSEEAVRQRISQTANVIDERLDAVLNISNTISASSSLLKTRYMELPFTAEKYYRLHKAARYLDAFTPLHGMVDSVFIYCGRLDCILDTGHIYTQSNQLPAVITQRIGLSPEAFRALMAQTNRNAFYLTKNREKIICVNTFDVLEKKPNLTAILVLNTQSISDTLAALSVSPEERAYLLTAGNEIFGRAEAEDLSEYSALAGEGRLTKLNHDGRVTLAAASQYADFSYVLSVPTSVFTRETRTIRGIYMITVAVLLAVGSLVAYYLASRNYRPIYALGQIADVRSTEKDELAAISHKIQEALSSRESMNRQIRELSQLASQQAFHALVTGDAHYMREHTNAGLNIAFTGDVFVAALLELESVADREPVIDLYQSGELNVVIGQILSNLCQDTCQYLIRREEETFVILLCFSHDQEDGPEMRALELMERLPNLILQSLSLTAQIFIGDAQQGLSQVHISCTNARRAQEYAEFIGETKKRVILYDPSMYSVEMPNKNYDIMDAERRFVQQLISGSYDQAKGILYQVLAYYRCQDGMSLYIMRCRMFGLMNLMINALHEIEPDVTADFYKECRPIERILSARNMRQLETVLFGIVDQLIGRQEHSPTDAQEKLPLIIGYIKSNYFRPELSVQMIADEFGLSLPYLSRIFKESHSVGMLTFINQYRVNKAKEMMAEDDSITLAEVAQRVGYNCSQTLIRIFKRHEGMTPGSYRAALTNDSHPQEKGGTQPS